MGDRVDRQAEDRCMLTIKAFHLGHLERLTNEILMFDP